MYQGFNHERFYEWAGAQDNIFISEYWMPDGFIKIANTEKEVKSASNNNGAKAIERIYTNRRTFEKSSPRKQEEWKYSTAEQMTMEG